nr:MAG: hypothetical protein BroJett040_07070 [Oligoflexia bacterium]
MVKWIIATFFGMLIGFMTYMMIHLGALKPVHIEEKSKPGFYLISKIHNGAYHKIVPIILDAEQWAKNNNYDCRFTFGEYFDDPETVEEGRLRSRGGCLMEKLPDGIEKNLPEGYEIAQISERQYVVATFEGSPGIGPMKVYPKVKEYMQQRRLTMNGSIMEIYEVKGPKEMTTTYLFPTALPGK